MSSIDNQNTNPAATLSDFAVSELQLSQQPFTTEPGSGESFVDGIAEAQLDDIKQALISGDDLLLILGPEGSGKSTLLNQLGAKSGQRIQCFSVHGSDRFSTANLFAGMLEAFKKQPPDDLKLMLDELIPCLQVMADHNTLGAVVLDDAHLIPESELTKLLSGMLYLNSSDETLLRVTLAAPTEFEERIPELLPEGADLPYSSLAIDAFDKVRSAAYLDFRLKQAGMTDNFPFDENEITAINEEAGGRPGLLHKVAAQHLNNRDSGFVSQLPPELEAREKKVAAGGGLFSKIGGTKLIAGALALAMILVGLFWLKPNGNDVPDDRYKVVENKKLDTNNLDTKNDAAELKAAENTVAENPAAATLAEEKPAELNQANQLGSAETSHNSADKTATIAVDTKAATAEAERQTKLDSQAEQQAKADKLAKEKLAAEQAKLAEQQAEEAKLAEQQAEQAKLAEQKAEQVELAKQKAEQIKLAEQQAAQTKPIEQLAAEEQTPSAAAALAGNDESEAKTQTTLKNLESPNWILVQNPALFTVQMSASKDLESVEDFLARTGLEPPNSIFSFKRNGSTWYALVHGLYNNIEEARQDIEKMPERTRSNQPWIRAVGRIQTAMKEQ